jgi:hypothetical protein
MLSKEAIAGYTKPSMKAINWLCGQNAEFWIVKAGVTYSYHWALKITRWNEVCGYTKELEREHFGGNKKKVNARFTRR